MDTSGDMDEFDSTEGGNYGLLQRSLLFVKSQIVSLEGPLLVDICQQDRVIPNGVQINVKLYPSSDNFRLMAGSSESFKLVITDAYMKVCNVMLNPEVMVAHNETWKNHVAVYPILHSQLKTFTIAKGSFEFTADGIYNGDVPNEVIVGLVKSAAYAGSYEQNFANFANFDLNYLQFSVDGSSTPTQAFTPSYINKDYVSEYRSLFFNRYPQTSGNFIRYSDYPNGYCLYVFNIAQQEREDVAPIARKGHCRLKMNFRVALPESVTVVTYARFSKVIQIDKTRNVSLK
jgi:hypothetical protein